MTNRLERRSSQPLSLWPHIPACFYIHEFSSQALGLDRVRAAAVIYLTHCRLKASATVVCVCPSNVCTATWLCSHVGCVCSPGTRGAGWSLRDLQATCRQCWLRHPCTSAQDRAKGGTPPQPSPGLPQAMSAISELPYQGPCLPSVENRSTQDPPGGLPEQSGFQVAGLREGKQVSRSLARVVDSHTDEVTAWYVPRSAREGRVPRERRPLCELRWPSWHDTGTGSFLPLLAGAAKGCAHLYPDSSRAVTGTRDLGSCSVPVRVSVLSQPAQEMVRWCWPHTSLWKSTGCCLWSLD